MLRNLSEYHRPENLSDALRLLWRTSPRTLPLGGGTTLVGEGGTAIEAVVDLRNLGLDYIRAENGRLRLGATTTLQAIIDSGELAGGALPIAARQTAGRTLRNMATLGGVLASADGRSPVVTVLLALDAQVTLHTTEEQQIPLPTFLAQRGALLDNHALIMEVAFEAELVSAYEQVGRTPADYPIVCAAAALRRASASHLAFGGVGAQPVRAEVVEAALRDQSLNEENVDAALANLTLDPPSDQLASAEYRREMARVLGRRVLLAAWGQV